MFPDPDATAERLQGRDERVTLALAFRQYGHRREPLPWIVCDPLSTWTGEKTMWPTTISSGNSTSDKNRKHTALCACTLCHDWKILNAMWQYVLAWLPMVAIAIANGVLREAWYGNYISELRAHQISTLTAVMLFSVYIWLVVRVWRPASSMQAIGVGLLWLAMTVAFEFLFGHFVAGHSWERLLHDYNLVAGRVWLIVLVWVTVAPYLFFRLRG